MADLQRPGGELASRPIHFFWVVDCSGSMSYDGKMMVNTAVEECIRRWHQLRIIANAGCIRRPNFHPGQAGLLQSLYRLRIIHGILWKPNGVTEMGKAF